MSLLAMKTGVILLALLPLCHISVCARSFRRFLYEGDGQNANAYAYAVANTGGGGVMSFGGQGVGVNGIPHAVAGTSGFFWPMQPPPRIGETCSGQGQCHFETGKCVCSGDFWGDHCQYHVPGTSGFGPMSPSPCMLGETCSGNGQCHLDTGKCVCNGYFTGEHCQNYDYCGSSELRCYNGGTCSNTMDVHGFQCHCPTYTTGSFCEHTTKSSTSTRTTTTTTTTTTTIPASTSSRKPTTTTTTTHIPQTTTIGFLHCDQYVVINGIAHNNVVSHSSGNLCASSRTQTGPDAFIIHGCHIQSTATWGQGKQVTSDCLSIPEYTPVAMFSNGSYPLAGGSAGVFIECLPNGFKMITQECDHAPAVVRVETGGTGTLNPDNYYTIV